MLVNIDDMSALLEQLQFWYIYIPTAMFWIQPKIDVI